MMQRYEKSEKEEESKSEKVEEFKNNYYKRAKLNHETPYFLLFLFFTFLRTFAPEY